MKAPAQQGFTLQNNGQTTASGAPGSNGYSINTNTDPGNQQLAQNSVSQLNDLVNNMGSTSPQDQATADNYQKAYYQAATTPLNQEYTRAKHQAGEDFNAMGTNNSSGAGDYYAKQLEQPYMASLGQAGADSMMAAQQLLAQKKQQQMQGASILQGINQNSQNNALNQANLGLNLAGFSNNVAQNAFANRMAIAQQNMNIDNARQNQINGLWSTMLTGGL